MRGHGLLGVVVLATAAAGGDAVLYDARAPSRLGPGITLDPKLTAAEERLLSGPAAGVRTKPRRCREGDLIRDNVAARAAGAFTARGVEEVAYVVLAHGCESLGLGPYATHLLIFRGQALVARASGKSRIRAGERPGFSGHEIRALADVDGDGISELVVTGSGFGQGILEQMARLYGAKAGRVELLHEAYGVYRDTCGGNVERRVEALVLRYAPAGKAGPLQITSEAYVAACPLSGDPRPEDFKPAKP